MCGREQAKLIILIVFVAGFVAFLFTENSGNRIAHAYSTGPLPGFTGAPGEFTCRECHLPEGAGTGQVSIGAPLNYVPGQSYQITVTSTNNDPTRMIWGFELTALDDSNERAGNLQPLNGQTQIIAPDVMPNPFPERQYIEHTFAGTHQGQQGGASWSFNWTAPATDVGPVTFYTAANHGNNSGSSDGDFIYTTFVASNPVRNQPIDDAQNFVRQHYLDFLNREPDPDGLGYWSGQITQCGSDASCINDKRVSVSAAFYIELEFQETGSVIYRLYRAAFGTMAAPNQTRANISFADFNSDRAQLVGGAGLEQSTRDFANNFVQRTAFLTEYPTSMTNDQFVNHLFDKANLAPFTTERQAEIDAMNMQGRTRAQVLLNVINNATFKTREYNPAFVLMQYFGYLRRDPDQGGYDFWLNVLSNAEPNNYRGMVCSFITSAEYQLRFGTLITRSNADCASIH
ncbi:MAG: choice-of-anchor V domain-containing protein [Pyrinomonadaceae bacterium]